MQNDLPPDCHQLEISTSSDPWHCLHAAATTLYPIQDDNEAMKSWCSLASEELKKAFSSYRRHYPVRRAWQHAPIHIESIAPALQQLAAAIGIKLV